MPLCLTLRKGDSVKIGDDIEIVLVRVKEKQVRIVFKAPEHISILRDEAKTREPKNDRPPGD